MTIEEKREKKRQALQRWRENNREKSRQIERDWRRANPEKARAKDQRRYSADPEKQRARTRQYSTEHREQVRAASRAWKAKNKEKVATYNAMYMPRWQANNEEKRKQYYREHYDEILVRVRHRAARKANAPGKHTLNDIADLFLRQKGHCAYFATCGNAIARAGSRKFHVDHIEPLAPQDKRRPTGSNNPDNIQLLCAACNMKKHNKDPYRFTQEHEGRLFPDLPRSRGLRSNTEKP